jgi:hypothetical protein
LASLGRDAQTFLLFFPSCPVDMLKLSFQKRMQKERGFTQEELTYVLHHLQNYRATRL